MSCKIGTFQVDITPTGTVDLAGFIARQQPMVGVHDPLFATAFVIEQEKNQFVYIVCDLLNLSSLGVAYIRKLIQEKTGIPPENIMISCTHTHSGPIATFIPPNSDQGVPITRRRKNLGTVNPQYIEELTQKLPELVVSAIAPENMIEIGHIEYNHGTIEGLNLDRRAEQGIKGIHGPLVTKNPEHDDSLQVVIFKSIHNKIQAVLVNFACHAVVRDFTNREVTADFPGVVVKTLKEKLWDMQLAEPGLQVYYINGACGNLNPVIMGGTWDEMEQFGRTIADAALNLIIDQHKMANIAAQFISVHAKSKIIGLPLRPLAKEEVQAQLEQFKREKERITDINSTEYKIKEAFIQWGEDTLRLIESGKAPTQTPMEVYVLAFDGVRIIGLSGEIFARIGKNIKSRLPGYTLIAGYTNGSSGYIPTAEALAEGGYETRDAYKFFATFPFSPEVAQVVENAAVSLALQK
ncbi:MAG: neutral/alkaline non-lysosomal ceramidase N-terminal domain-containing protein [bacterium]|nr:neutral/alkaline non-lysosomal ceramidase N-terminal domain-containing protein [bacterium]